MPENLKTSDTLANQPAPPTPETIPAAPVPRGPAMVQVNDSKAIACYANFCRVTGTPEELIPQPEPNSLVLTALGLAVL